MRQQVIIENPVINSPFEEPQRHFRFTEDGITDEIVDARRISAYFVPISPPKKKNKQIALFTQWTQDRVEENKFINRVREAVDRWRRGRYVDITKTTGRLLEYWKDPARELKLFFCQIEAMETAVYITEVARKYDPWIENELRLANEEANPLLFRLAFKMATGSGKTVVMAMLIAWHVLNKIANPKDARFSDTFLVVTPGITIRDRLRVLLPNDPDNYYRKMDLVPPDLLPELGKGKILVTNFHAFKPRERVSAGKLTKTILSRGQKQGKESLFTETPDQMVRRVCRDLGNKKNIVIINDEAHHCYRRKSEPEPVKLVGEERKEIEKREEEARVWISGLEAVKSKLGARVIYDLSATPFFLRGSGYPEGTLFPWVVSDFSLIDAIECGIVKVPRVPVSDNAMVGGIPTYRDIWHRIRDHLPKKGRGTEEAKGEPKLPAELEGAIQSLYQNYAKYYDLWLQTSKDPAHGLTPPVFILVCSNTNVSKMVFDYIAGYEKSLPDGSIVAVPGNLPLFSNVVDGIWSPRPSTILVDSAQLESGDAMSAEFKKIASREIEEFKAEYRVRFPGRDAEDLTDEDLLREVMNTVGKPGKLGERIKCVVSVSMLTEGWDANTVTHILGVRAFSTQLLCEQVVGRGLRRMSYAVDPHVLTVNGKTLEYDAFPVEYAEVYGVPFSFIPCAGSQTTPKPGQEVRRVRALQERIACEITFPRVTGYCYEFPAERLSATFTKDTHLTLSTAEIPTRTENAPIIGESTILTLDDLKQRRKQEVAFLLAKLVLETCFRDDGGALKPWLFPQIFDISKRWLKGCVTLKDNTFAQLLLLIEPAHMAAEKIYNAIAASAKGEKSLKPILRPYDTVGSTRFVDFNTTRGTYATHPDKCHVSHVVLDSDWEAKMAETLESMDDVIHYVKNYGVGFFIPYTLNGEERSYYPDYLVLGKRPNGETVNLVVEVTGARKKDKEAKVAAALNLWVPAVNNHFGFGSWAFVEITDPWNAEKDIGTALRSVEA
ncbi:MAG: BPTD_3080 family restriction endonuclease [Thermodesulfobacteriota bacterium]